MKQNNTVMKYIKIFKIYLVFLALFIIMTFASPAFFTKMNILNLLRQLSINGIIATGMTFVIITGGIDLSVGSILALSSIVACDFIHPNTYPVIVPVLIALVIGAVCGGINGVIIAKGKVPAFIVTMGMMTICRGMTLMYNNGKAITNFDENFKVIGGGTFLSIPIPIYILILTMIVGGVLLGKMRLGRYVYAVGGNESSAKISGINVDRIIICVYVIAGILSALAGIVLSSRVITATATAGDGYELDAIAAVVIGGTSLSGGVGSVAGTLAGVLIIGVLNNGLDLLNVPSYYQQVIQGVIIIGSVFVDQYFKSKKQN